MAAVLPVGATSFGAAAIGVYLSQALPLVEGPELDRRVRDLVAWAFAARLNRPLAGT